MESSLKSWGMLLLLLGLQTSLLAQVDSWIDFIQYHHLNSNKAFSAYKCDELMMEKNLFSTVSNTFVYMSQSELENVCGGDNLTDRYINTYASPRVPIKVLQCDWKRFDRGYIDRKSFNNVLFHCGEEGYVDSIEEMTFLEPITD